MSKRESKKPKTKGKIPDRFDSSSFDYSDFEEEKKSKAIKMKKSSLKDYDQDFRGKLRRLFTPDETKKMVKQQQISSDSLEKYEPKDYIYIQMKLNLLTISDDFEEEIEEYRLSGVQIRKAEQEDLDIFVKLYNRSFMRGHDPWSPATEDQFKDILDHKQTVVLIGNIQGEDVGFIITDLEGENQDIGVIVGLGTDPRYQRKGIGRYLGIASWDYFSKKNVKELRCEVYEKNIPSYRLIKSLHFKEYGKKIYKF